MTTVEAALEIPGVCDLPEDVYHADPVPGGSLSSTGARRILPPGCPALFDHERREGRPDTSVFEFGRAAHSLVLGVGAELVLVDRDRWDTNAVKAEVAAIRAAGKIPLKCKDLDTVHAMAAALRAHPLVGKMFQPGNAVTERCLFWRDPATGVVKRARCDWLPHPLAPRHAIVVDYKTCDSADPDAVARSMYRWGYHQQADWYQEGVTATGAADSAAFLLICQEKTPPYLVTVAQPSDSALRVGRARNRRAVEIYRDCTESGIWPGYTPGRDVVVVDLPAYAPTDDLE